MSLWLPPKSALSAHPTLGLLIAPVNELNHGWHGTARLAEIILADSRI